MKHRLSKMVLLMAVAILVAVAVALNFLFFKTPFLYAGTLEATKVDLSARQSDILDQVKVQEGDRITEGETLVTFVCSDYKSDARLAHENYDRYIKLLKPGWTTPE